MCAGPEDVFLALRGLRTMALRLKEHERQALDMARWLAARPEVARVLHPALESDPGHAIWKRDFKGSSGLFSIVLEPAPKRAMAAMLDGLELFGMGYSWGGFESLVDPVRLRRLPHRHALESGRARRCASISASKTSTISRPISMPGSRGCGARPRRRREGQSSVVSRQSST